MEVEDEYYGEDCAADVAAHQTHQMMAGELPDLSDEKTVNDFIAGLDDWD